jgi:hypothetical protein
MSKKLGKLISYKKKEKNLYRTFTNSSIGSRESVQIKPKSILKPTQKVYPQIHTSKRNIKTVRMNVNGTKESNSSKCWKQCSCCRCPSFRKCFQYFKNGFCCKRKRASNNVDDEEDIDKAFERYKQEMCLKEMNVNSGGQESQRSTLQSEKDKEKGAARFWSWNESWKSNSDKFLDSLEYDCNPYDKSLKRRLKQKSVKVRMSVFRTDEG